MNKEAEEKETQVSPEPQGSPEGESKETPTVEDRIKELEEKYSQAEARATEKAEGFKSLQRQLQAEQREKKELEERLTDRESNSDLFKAMLGLMAEQRGQSEDDIYQDVSTRKPDLMKQFEQLETKREQKAMEKKVNTLRKRVEDMGYQETDREYLDVYNAVVSGNIPLAEKLTNKLEAQAEEKSKVENPKESEEERINRLAEERAEKMLEKKIEEKGLYKTDAGSSAGMSDGIPLERDRLRDYISNLSDAEYKEKKPKINALLREGKIQ